MSFTRVGLRASAILAAITTVAAGIAVAPAAHAVPVALAAETGTTYYLDAQGDDSGAGTSPETAWASLDKIAATTFRPGDRLLLQSGDTWTGQLWPKGSGTADAPITVGRYGSGDKPAIRGEGQVDDAVKLFNQSHWTLSQFDVSNERTGGATAADNLADLRGIHVSGDNSQTLGGFVIDQVDVHDVTGEVAWISGSPANNKPGIRFKTGWDGAKRTGGIVFDTTVPDLLNPPAQPTLFDGITIQNSTIRNTSFAGIVVKQHTGDGYDADGNPIATYTGWGQYTKRTDTNFAPHKNIAIRGNYITQEGSEYGCNGMLLVAVRGAVVEDNVVYKAGTVGIETNHSDDVTIQYNEVYETEQKAGGADHSGIDPDRNTTRQLIQYNYLHHNGDGVLLCQFGFGDTVLRYNVIAENSRHQIYLHSDRDSRAQIYNNTIYNTKSNTIIYGFGSYLNAKYEVFNNVIHSTRANAALTTASTIDYQSNVYSGAELAVPADDTTALVGDAQFASPSITGPFGTVETGPRLDTAAGYALQSGAKGVNRAVATDPVAVTDLLGTPVPAGAGDVGAFEYATAAGATSETVSGFVADGNGRTLAGATVRVASGSSVKQATTDVTGWYRIPAVPFGTVSVSAERTGYSAAPVSVEVSAGTSAKADVVLQSTSNVGTVSGQVVTAAGTPLEGAIVTIAKGTAVAGTATSNAEGRYSIEAAIGDDYVISAGKDGLRGAEVSGVDVNPGSDTAVRALIVQATEPTVLFADDVQSRPVGAFTSADGYAVSAQGGSVQVADSAGDRSFLITRSTNSGSTSIQRNMATPYTGLVTVEAEVRRDARPGSGTSWFSLPYVYGADGKPVISVAMNRTHIVAYKGTTSTELRTWETGRDYTFTLQVDTVNQTFDLLIDGELVIDDAAFRAPLVGGISRIEWYANSSNYGSAHVDDIRVLQGTDRDRSDAGIVSITTDAGDPARSGDAWLLNVPAATAEIRATVIPTAAVVSGLTIGGAAAQPGQPSAPITLEEGVNAIPVVVTAEDGSTASYTLEVDRAPLAADATLSSLQVGAGTLTPAFDPAIEDYAVTLPAGATSLAVTATTVSPASSITVDGQTASSGTAFTTPVSDGHIVKVYVGSSDGTAYTTYAITVAVPEPPVAVDTVKPTATLVSPTTAGPFRTLSIRVDATDETGLQRVVANIYKDGVLVKSTQTAANGAKSATHTAEVTLPSGTYAIKYNAQDLAGNIAPTGLFTVTVDATAPTVTVKTGANETVGADGVYSLVSFKLYDAGKIDKVVLNGVMKNLTDNAWSDVNDVKPGVFGAVSGANTLVVYDVAGNTTTIPFTLN